MPKTRITLTLERATVEALDRRVREAVFASRSQGIQVALDEKLQRVAGGRLARECAKLDPRAEKALADEGLAEDLAEWPEY